MCYFELSSMMSGKIETQRALGCRYVELGYIAAAIGEEAMNSRDQYSNVTCTHV